MRRLFRLFILWLSAFVFLPLTGSSILFGQNSNWSSITSYNTINGLVVTETDTFWGVSNGGLFSFSDTSFVDLLTPVDGMYRLDGSKLVYIEELNSIAIGYLDGMIDLYDLSDRSFERVEDIFRVRAFTSKSINDFELFEDKLYVATEFGIVVYDINSFLVTESYTKIGRFDRGAPILDISIAENTIIVGSQQGVGMASIEDNLSLEESWVNYDENEGLPDGNVISVEQFNDRIFASLNDGVYYFNHDSWQIYPPLNDYTGVTFLGLSSEGDLRSFNNGRILFVDQNQNLSFINPGVNDISDVVFGATGENEPILSTLTSGIGIRDTSTGQFNLYAPEGPNLNFFEGMSFKDGIFISGTTRLSQLNSTLDNRKGYYIRDENGWRNFNRTNNGTLLQNTFRQAFTSTFTDEYYYFGSWGQGIARHNRETDVIDVFDASNSTLRGWAADDPNFPVISGLETDENGAVWATSRYATNPLYVQLPGENEWINYGKSAAVNQNDEYLYLFVDSYNQKWITLETAGGTGRGVLVLDTGDDPSATDESTGVKLTDDQGNGNLPNISVTSIIEDNEGEVWVGTERGIARFIFPQFVISGSQEERRAQWLINEDPDAASPFLLRDINVTAMAVNAANQKWIGTAAEGVWLLNQTGSAILERFTSENSPLFSNAIRDISINDETGEVYISTDAGLSVYQDIPVEASPSMDELKVYPNPFLYERHNSITIEGLTDITTVRVLGVDGSLIRVIENRGGRVSWDGKDSRGNDIGSGVYVIVALGPDGDERGIGKVAIIR